MIVSVDPNGPARTAGVLVGDVFIGVDGEAVSGVRSLLARLTRRSRHHRWHDPHNRENPMNIGKLLRVLAMLAAPILMAATVCYDDRTCDTSTWNGTPCAPKVPAQYVIPAGATVVRNYNELSAALASSTTHDIVLEDGAYQGPSIAFYTTQRLWARHVGAAVLNFGLEAIAPNVGVHGLKWAITSSGNLGQGQAAIHAANGNFGRVGYGLQVSDVTIDGGNVTAWGIYSQSPSGGQGVKIERVVLTQFTGAGILVYAQGVSAQPPIQIRDVQVSYVKNPDPNCCNGTSEFGIMFGSLSAGAVLERVDCHRVDWSCVIPFGDGNGLVASDLRLDYTNDHAFYIEHYAGNVELKRFVIGPNVGNGYAIEGAQPGWGWKPAGTNYKVHDGTINTARAGMSVGPCEGPLDVQRVKFQNQCQTAMIDNTNVPYNAGHCTPAGPFTQSNNVFQMLPGAQVTIKNAHDYGAGLCDSKHYSW
jgi:hypothetical protein